MADRDDIMDLNAPLTPPPNGTLKRRAESQHVEGPVAKRTWTEADITPDKKLVPLIPHQHNAAASQLQEELSSAANDSDNESEDEWMDAEENLGGDGEQNVHVMGVQHAGDDVSASAAFSGAGQNGLESSRPASSQYGMGGSGHRTQIDFGFGNSNNGRPAYGSVSAPGTEETDTLQLFPGLGNDYGGDYDPRNQHPDIDFFEAQAGVAGSDGQGQAIGGEISSQHLPHQYTNTEFPAEDYAPTQNAQHAAIFNQQDVFTNTFDPRSQPAGAVPEVEEIYDDEDEDEEMKDDTAAQPDSQNSEKAQNSDAGGDESMDESDNESSSSPEEDQEEEEDLFASTFGRRQEPETIDSDSDSDIEIVGQNDAAMSQSLKAMGYNVAPSNRPSTPPLPVTIRKSTSQTSGVNKTSATTSSARAAQLARSTPNADKIVLPRDINPQLRAFYHFHNKCLHFIPHLPNWSTLDHTRRYWIAVLHIDKKPHNAKSEKDFMWMKGNKLSTIFTIWASYQVRSQVAEEELVLVNRGHILGPEVRAEELDWFNEKFVVLRAMHRKEAEANTERAQFANDVGIIREQASEVIELDD